MKKLKNLITTLPTICALLLGSSALLQANEETLTEATPVTVGERDLPPEELLAHEIKRANEPEDEIEIPENVQAILNNAEIGFVAKSLMSRDSTEQTDLTAAVKGHRVTEKQAVYTTHPGAFHTLMQMTLDLNTGILLATLEDGSFWNIRSNEQFLTGNWLLTDPILIGPSGDFFFPFWLTNQRTNSAVRASMTIVYPNIYTRQITYVDAFLDRVELNDGSIWDMTGSDYSITKQWRRGESVIICVNNGKQASRYPNILYDVNTNSYARGICTFHY